MLSRLQARVNWEDLPLDVLAQIATFVMAPPRAASSKPPWAMRGACTTWKAGFELTVTKIDIRHKLCPKYPKDSTSKRDDWIPGGLKIVVPDFRRFPGVVKVRLSFFSLTSASLAGLQWASKLREVHLLGCDFPPRVFSSLWGMSQLERLSLNCCWVNPESLVAISKLPITSLGVTSPGGGCVFTANSGFRALQGMTQLVELDISGWDNLSAGALYALGEFPNLRVLCSKNWHVELEKSSGVFAFRRLQITTLDITNVAGGLIAGGYNDDVMSHLRHLPLTSLNVRGGAHPPNISSVSDAGLGFLEGIPLTNLGLGGNVLVTDEGIEFLRDMPLTSLSLEGCDQISDEGLEFLWEVPLTSLDLAGCPLVTDQGLLALCCRGMPLQSLRLGSDRVVPSGLEGIVVEAVPAAVRRFSSHPWAF